jgi:hypothetical protein
MAARSGPPSAAAVAAIRIAAISDIILGVLIAIFAESVVPMGDIAPGVRLWWVVGGVLAMGGVGAFLVAAALMRKRREAAGGGRPTEAGPVNRG